MQHSAEYSDSAIPQLVRMHFVFYRWQCNENREADDLLMAVPFPLGEAFRLFLEVWSD